MRATRIETVIQFVRDQPGAEPLVRDIPPGRLVTLSDPDGNIVELIDNSKGGMPGQRA
jgi:hypothetical protein